MNLLWFENLLLMRLWVWNAYLVLLWNRALAYPRALLPSGGPLSREFWQLTTPLTLATLKYICIKHEDQRAFSIWNHHNYINVLLASVCSIWIPMSWIYDHIFNFFSAGTDFRRQNLTSADVTFWRLKLISALKGLMMCGLTCIFSLSMFVSDMQVTSLTEIICSITFIT